MDKLDCQILQAIQNDFPLSDSPYETLSQKLQIPRQELWNRVVKLLNEGMIRRIGASLNSRDFSYSSTLAAICVEGDVVEKASKIIGKFPEITHSYLRSDDFNVWFTIIASDNERVENILEQIRSALSLEKSQILNLPMKRLFKLDARFKIQPE
jgi:DNA-binding Lrp family transcriptional regulator